MRRFKLNYLLIFIPIAVGLYWYGANSLLVFVMAALTIVPLSKIVGTSTETLADYCRRLEKGSCELTHDQLVCGYRKNRESEPGIS
jgi:hypothetical protein